MFYYLDGVITVIEPGVVVSDVNGAGYKCFATANTMSYLEVGKKSRLYTYCNIKEDAFDIYGFYDISERRCFEMLLSVSGVGPKAALSLLSVNTPESLAMGIITDNDKILSAAPGIGKKTAQRIILELKDKMAKESISLKIDGGAMTPSGAALAGGKLSEASAALAMLGYSQSEITTAMRSIDVESMTTEEIIRAVLKGSVK